MVVRDASPNRLLEIFVIRRYLLTIITCFLVHFKLKQPHKQRLLIILMSHGRHFDIQTQWGRKDLCFIVTTITLKNTSEVFGILKRVVALWTVDWRSDSGRRVVGGSTTISTAHDHSSLVPCYLHNGDGQNKILVKSKATSLINDKTTRYHHIRIHYHLLTQRQS